MRITRLKSRSYLAAAAAFVALFALGAPAGPADAAAGSARYPRLCVGSQVPDSGPARDIVRIAEQAKAEMGLKSVILRVTSGGREVVTTALGESMTAVPATPAMHFRNGNIAISYMGTALLRLVDQGRVNLDDPVSHWLPGLPPAMAPVTLRMLAASTTGLIDYVKDPGFIPAVGANPFRQWTADELVSIATTKDLLYAPGTNWNYSHANFVLLGAALEKITGTRLDHLLQQQIMGPLGLRQTANSFTPEIPEPVLHAFTADRGTYEETTFWNPSWTTAPGAVQTTDICDLARSAEAIGAGELLSPAAYQQLLNPGTVGLGTPTEKCPATLCIAQTQNTHYGMGVLVLGDWVSQHPLFFGYSATQNYLPCARLAIAVSTTQNPGAQGGHTAHLIAQRIAAALAPGHPIPNFG
ncbi:serine hydrolase domain-containing protein [Yinghuangia soli]|uniref:Beta-lactamase family protein n=1 Tax=Yinghuangia soli TaxID=2908204 RepID=A0AA41Q8D1_9ACTN|nr:serine hydrolase domain-containing protein [Yinghuangia soli]MCF2533122.1 beta-lactamase family protein [Yinghuangia soli]